jgi:hypothetical protein
MTNMADFTSRVLNKTSKLLELKLWPRSTTRAHVNPRPHRVHAKPHPRSPADFSGTATKALTMH